MSNAFIRAASTDKTDDDDGNVFFNRANSSANAGELANLRVGYGGKWAK